MDELTEELAPSRSTENAMWEALYAYHEFETWKVLPMSGGLYDQAYEWVKAVECVRMAHLKAQAEEAASRRRSQNASFAADED